jgi:hypothetical protein
MTHLTDLTNHELADLICLQHREREYGAEHALAEAERRGIKLTVTMRRHTINLREGYHTDDGTYEVEKHAYDVAAGLEAL